MQLKISSCVCYLVYTTKINVLKCIKGYNTIKILRKIKSPQITPVNAGRQMIKDPT